MFTHFTHSFFHAAVAAALVVGLLLSTYFTLEPKIMVAADVDSDTFTVNQTIVGELAFVTTANDVTMSQNISGLTGGTATGSTIVAVRANNATGYNMTIAFSSTTAMNRPGGGFIRNYTPAATGTPDFTFITPTGSSEFAYTVEATELGDETLLFRDNGSACGVGSANAVDTCWYGVANATNTVTIINRGSATPSTGATTTIKFRVGVDANPSPALPTGVYTATATLTATEN